jgi:hypothetical protein
MTTKDDGVMNSFDTGATRDTSEGKLDSEGFTHPKVMEQFYKFMNMHRLQSDGKLRDSDNWQKGIPIENYMKSLTRHREDVWAEYRGFETENGLVAGLCGIIFNAMGYLLEDLKKDDFVLRDFDGDDPIPEIKARQEKLARKYNADRCAEFSEKSWKGLMKELCRDCGNAPCRCKSEYFGKTADEIKAMKMKDILGIVGKPVRLKSPASYNAIKKVCVSFGLDPDKFLISPEECELRDLEAEGFKDLKLTEDGGSFTVQQEHDPREWFGNSGRKGPGKFNFQHGGEDLCKHCGTASCEDKEGDCIKKAEMVEGLPDDSDYKLITFPNGETAWALKSVRDKNGNPKGTQYPAKVEVIEEPHDHHDITRCSCETCTPNKGKYGAMLSKNTKDYLSHITDMDHKERAEDEFNKARVTLTDDQWADYASMSGQKGKKKGTQGMGDKPIVQPEASEEGKLS